MSSMVYIHLHGGLPADCNDDDRERTSGPIIGPVEGVNWIHGELHLVSEGDTVLELEIADGLILLDGMMYSDMVVLPKDAVPTLRDRLNIEVLTPEAAAMRHNNNDHILEAHDVQHMVCKLAHGDLEVRVPDGMQMRINRWASGLVEMAIYEWTGAPNEGGNGHQLVAAWCHKTGRRLT